MLYGWKENSILTNCLAACAHLSITVSEIHTAFYHTPCIRRPRYWGSRRNIGTLFGSGKLEWCRYQMVKKISKISLFVLVQLRNVTDRQTDGRTPGDGNSRAMHSIARQQKTERKRKHNLKTTQEENAREQWLPSTSRHQRRACAVVILVTA